MSSRSPRRHNPGASRAKNAEYRQSDAGRMARKMYRMQPEVRAKMAERRRVKRKMKGGF